MNYRIHIDGDRNFYTGGRDGVNLPKVKETVEVVGTNFGPVMVTSVRYDPKEAEFDYVVSAITTN